MTRDDVLAIVHEYIKNENLFKHMLSVEAAMRFYAEKYGEDVELWGNTGLLHDFDWEVHPTAEQHPQDGAPILRERGVPAICAATSSAWGNRSRASRRRLSRTWLPPTRAAGRSASTTRRSASPRSSRA